eukprot:CCRYP_009242-RA/>CCRYP_009242-RA protein AED:0.37 eAED:0.37 QI:0/0/0/1/0/0/2/0/141
MSPTVRQLAQSQDEIEWTHFTKGKISKLFAVLQSDYLLGFDTVLTGQDWWIYRNVTLHYKERGYLTLKCRQALVTEIHSLHDTNPQLIPAKSRLLLDLDITEISALDNERQDYWIATIQAAQTASLCNLSIHQSPQPNSHS